MSATAERILNWLLLFCLVVWCGPAAAQTRPRSFYDETEAVTPAPAEPETPPAELPAEEDLTPVAETPAPPAAPVVRCLAFEQPGCRPCDTQTNQLLPLARQAGLVVGFAGRPHIQRVNGLARPDLVERYDVDAFPTVVVTADDVEVARFVGLTPAQTILDAYQRARLPARPVGAISIGRLPGARAGVKSLIDAAKELLGTQGSLRVVLSRNGASTVELKDNLSVNIPNPLTVDYAVVGGDTLRITFPSGSPGLRTRFVGLPAQQKIDAVTVEASAITFELPRMVDVRLAIED